MNDYAAKLNAYLASLRMEQYRLEQRGASTVSIRNEIKRMEKRIAA